MMKVLLALLIMSLCYSSTGFTQTETTQLRGQGEVNFLGFIKVYDAYLYTSETTAEITTETETDVLSPEVSKCLKIQYEVSLSKDNFIEGANTVLSRQHSEEIIGNFQDELTQLHSSYQPVTTGDVYTLCYDADSAVTTLNLNNSLLTEITSKEFSTLYFGIWLADNQPLDKQLREDLLYLPDNNEA